MRKYLVIIGIVAITIFCNNVFAAGDKTITSQKYVENQLATKQDKIPAVDTNTVITHTGTNGEIGQKGIYDSTGNYAEQQTSLMTAGDANTGINNALENEFICIDWDTDGTCLIWQIKNTSPQQILPTGYTALEYLDGNAGPYINTLVSGNNNDLRIVVKFNVLSFGGREYLGRYYDGVLGNYAGESVNMWRILLSANQGSCTISGSACDLKITGYANSIPGSGNLFYNTNIELNQDYIVDFSQTHAFINGQVPRLRTGDSQGSAGTSSIKLFAGGANGGTAYYSNTRIYYFLLYNGDNLVRNMIPARRESDGMLGMYDLVSNQFFTKNGSGTFSAGSDITNVYVPSGN